MGENEDNTGARISQDHLCGVAPAALTDQQRAADLLARVKAATGPDRRLDRALWATFQGGDYPGVLCWDGLGVAPFTASLDAALALVERVLPGVWYVLGKGKLRADEPLYGAKLLFTADGTLGEGEHEHSQALALLAALLSALTTADRLPSDNGDPT